MATADSTSTHDTPRAVVISTETLPQLSALAATPDYDRSLLRRSIVHLGVGGFHRAHLATYVHELCEQGETDWSIVGAGLLPNDTAISTALTEQDHLYTLISRSADATEVEIIGSIVDFLFAADNAEDLIATIAADTTQIVSMTITEGGYPVDDVSGVFLADKCPDGSAFAVLAHGLERRRATGGGKLTVLSCDNIMSNGDVARTAMLGAAATVGDELVAWIGDNVSFPNSMVDRITPATTAADIEWLKNERHIADRWPVVAEPFRQWVVEDDFAGERLPLESLDVIITANIEPYELTKLRLLNAGHSCLAYLAALDGHLMVDAAMADPTLRAFVFNLLDTEAKPTLPPAAGIDLDDYIASLIERFSNPAVGDQISRLCFDGTSKFPKFLIPTIRARLASNDDVRLCALALAGWCEYLNSADGSTTGLAADPLLDTAVDHARRSLADPSAFLELTEVFGEDLRASEQFVEAFTSAVSSLRERGVQSALAEAMTGAEPADDRNSD